VVDESVPGRPVAVRLLDDDERAVLDESRSRALHSALVDGALGGESILGRPSGSPVEVVMKRQPEPDYLRCVGQDEVSAERLAPAPHAGNLGFLVGCGDDRGAVSLPRGVACH
jgi:hypothetical protein